jgi:hypothetical protein
MNQRTVASAFLKVVGAICMGIYCAVAIAQVVHPIDEETSLSSHPLSVSARRVEAPIEVTVESLVAQIDRLDGKLVRVRGVLGGAGSGPYVRANSGSAVLALMIPGSVSNDNRIQPLLASAGTASTSTANRPARIEVTGRASFGRRGVTLFLVGMSPIEASR